MGQAPSHDHFHEYPVKKVEPRSRRDILADVKANGSGHALSDKQVREAQEKFASYGIPKTSKPQIKNRAPISQKPSLWSKLVNRTHPRTTDMSDFLDDLATREISRTQIDAKQAELDARLRKSKQSSPVPKKIPLPAFLTRKTPMALSNQRAKNKNLREEYKAKSQTDLDRVSQSDEVYTKLLAHVTKEGKATNRTIENFLASSENYKNGLTQGITNINLRDAVKIFGKKLEQEDFINSVQQGAVRVRKVDVASHFKNAVQPDPLRNITPSITCTPTLQVA